MLTVSGSNDAITDDTGSDTVYLTGTGDSLVGQSSDTLILGASTSVTVSSAVGNIALNSQIAVSGNADVILDDVNGDSVLASNAMIDIDTAGIGATIGGGTSQLYPELVFP